ncbi:cache domain-containing protein [Arcobacter sp. LA11]|uniref:sensor histidine kinase n=1 Tax=Arcobacter sp. LA11 TaxID=1898176 RepID=UPI000933C9CA|nr:cache domain-containing protein [Arcobacter sp. LA11]
MLINSEKQLLNFVKYSPIVVIMTIAIIVNSLIYIQNEKNFRKDLEVYKKNYIETNKALIKVQVEKVYNDVINEKAKLEKELHKDLENSINQAYSIIENIYNKFSDKDDTEILELIKEALRNIRFNNDRGYFYIFNMKGENVLHPLKPQLEGKSVLGTKDKKGQLITETMIENLKKKDTFFNELYWFKPNDLKGEYKKITFNKLFKPLGIFVGTGEYIDDFTKNLKNHMIEDHIQKITYGKNGYVFIFDYDGTQLAHVKESYIGKNRLNLKDANGFEITKEIIKKAKEGSGYIKYIGTIMPETGKPASKVTYIKGLEDWQWAIASGFYDKELIKYLDKKEKELKEINDESLKNTMIISLLMTIFLLFIATYISDVLKKFFDNYNKRILKELNANRKKDMILYQQSKMASMGEMIGNIAHQWRQPLNLISTATSRIKLEDDLGILTKDTQNESINAILKSTKYLSQTIDDFREFFNPNKIAKEFTTEELYEKTVQLTSSRFSNRNIHIIKNIQNFQILTYENELIQAIINILNNAIDAFETSKQNEKIILFDIKRVSECKMQDCEVSDCSEFEQDGKMIITIKDNAGGIPKQNIEKIFEAYFTTKHQSQGTGIGLYMTYQIIQKHLEGFISVENKTFKYKEKEYKGAEFSITIPLN